MVNLINLEENRLNHIVTNELKPRIREQMNQVLLPPREEVINHDHLISPPDKLINEMAPDESSSTCHHDPQPPPSDTDGNTTCCFTSAVIKTHLGRRVVITVDDGSGDEGGGLGGG
ncbi:unnamed protein product [Brassica oleracea]